MPEKNYLKLTTHITVRKYSYLFCVNKNIHIYYRHRHTRDGFRNLITGFLLHQNIIVYHKMYPCVFQICEIDIWGINQRLKSKIRICRFIRYKVKYMYVCVPYMNVTTIALYMTHDFAMISLIIRLVCPKENNDLVFCC